MLIKSQFRKNQKKKRNVTPIYKKNSWNDKANYWPVSNLSNLPKVYENRIFDEMAQFFDDIFSKNQCGFREGLVQNSVHNIVY